MANTVLSPAEIHAPTSGVRDQLWPYYLLFLVSGFPALLYQVVWERALFAIYGVNIQSVTVIVTVFMLGLGLGSLAGGWLSVRKGVHALRAFGLIEASTGVFGAVSLWIFHRVAEFTAGASTAETGVITFLLLLVPTMLMGSTLPLLVSYLVRRTANVGESVGLLYAVNTLGSGLACFCAALFLMRLLGESGSVNLAVCLNLLVGVTALLLPVPNQAEPAAQAPEASIASGAAHATIPLPLGLLLAAASGFIALAYEIIWYRLYSFTSGNRAPSFAALLAFYLFGIAFGSVVVHHLCKHKLRDDLGRTLRAGATVVLLGSIASYLLGPVVGLLAVQIPYPLTFPLIALAAGLLGASFPILSHAAIGPTEQAGKRLSYIYLSNIVGSALGSFLVGFVLLDHWSTAGASRMLLGLGFVLATILALLAKPAPSKLAIAAACVACAALAAVSGPLYSGMFEHLLLKRDYTPGLRFANLVENRTGLIAVTPWEVVYGGGVYDGRFDIDPVHDTNGIFRAYAIPGLRSDLKDVLDIGLSSGSWAQVLVNAPTVQNLTIVEINPGYTPLIRERSIVSSLLQNPKAHIIIDDGRRWLVAHPDRKFDFILMNTTYNNKAHASLLLSADFLRLIRKHLKPGGVAYYNTTSSSEAQLTGATVFPYALRFANFMAVSDSPIVYDRERMRKILTDYKIDGRPMFNLANPLDRAQLESIVSIPFTHAEHSGMEPDHSMETRDSLLQRFRGQRIITDDNMGTEWNFKVGAQMDMHP